jgi:hypothetical protein
MHITASPWIAAGFAASVAGAGAIAAPVIAPATSLPAVESHAVRLVSGDVTWDEVLHSALTNSTAIYDHLSPAAFADVQQFAANVPAYFDGTRNFATDLGLAYTAATNPFIPTDPEPYIYPSVDPASSNISIDVLSLLVGDDEAAQIAPYLEFSGSPLSGILWGSFGTTVSPLLQLHDDFASIASALSGSTHDYAVALKDVVDIPANVTNAFLNGYGDISLDTLTTDFGISAPSGVDVTAIELDFGGLLSPGGSLIDGIGITGTLGSCSIVCATLDVPSSAVGPIASLFEQDQAIAEAIGWDGVGQPLAHLFTDLTTLFN